MSWDEEQQYSIWPADYVEGRSVADLDLETMEGTGHLEILEQEAADR